MADWIVETLHVWKPDLTALLASAQKSWRQQKSCVDPVPKCGGHSLPRSAAPTGNAEAAGGPCTSVGFVLLPDCH